MKYFRIIISNKSKILINNYSIKIILILSIRYLFQIQYLILRR